MSNKKIKQFKLNRTELFSDGSKNFNFCKNIIYVNYEDKINGLL